MSFEEMWASLLPIGRDAATGGYHRFAWRPAELDCREWFVAQARARDLDVERDRNGNLFAWWHPEHDHVGAGAGPEDVVSVEAPANRRAGGAAKSAVLTGSHLDSVPGGGAFDGPLGVVSAFAAIELLRERGVTPARPIGVGAFAEEEGARFGVACLGSRLLTGAIDPARARALTDADGVTLADVLGADGLDPAAIGRDDELLGRIGCFVELHVEQGRALVDHGAPVGVASAIWPHGRWRFDFAGEGNHAGTTWLRDRHDPMLPFAHTVLAARHGAARHDALATVGKVGVTPGGVNAIPSAVTAWLDARGPSEQAVRDTVEDIRRAAERAAAEHGVRVTLTEESYTSLVGFDTGLAGRLRAALTPDSAAPPVLPTGAGHDAGILSALVPAAMLFVRNPTGVSHAPQEHAESADCLAGVEALAAVLQDLAGDPAAAGA
jgi:N-carbamoyl-L-amino-acid hydrolase